MPPDLLRAEVAATGAEQCDGSDRYAKAHFDEGRAGFKKGRPHANRGFFHGMVVFYLKRQLKGRMLGWPTDVGELNSAVYVTSVLHSWSRRG